MILSKKKMVGIVLSVILFGGLCFTVGVVYSNGGTPTIEPAGMSGFDWYNATMGVYAPEFWHEDLGNYTAWIISIEGGEGVTDHGSLTGLADDDHPQYQTNEYPSSGLADHAYSGSTMTGTAGENLVIGEIVFLNSDGKYWETDADLTTKMFCVAMALESISADSTGLFLFEGYLRDDSWSGWTPGSVYPLFVSLTPGEMTQTAPTGTGDQVQVVGYPIASKIVRFDPVSTVVEVT